ncbi:Uncharacterized protein Adt_27645 [Abeliophyllum distichum]|uniref:Uncharacterized protein n=1 Tax=Abeliophyllum distichum TaxID=126358 RepID=A0ABD1RUC2_9LAMI
MATKWIIRKHRLPRILNWQATNIPNARNLSVILNDPGGEWRWDGVGERGIGGVEESGGGAERDRGRAGKGEKGTKGVQAVEVLMERMLERTVVPCRKRKDEGIIEVPEVVGKRVRIPSSYMSSLFTTRTKRRTFADGTKVDLFQKVDSVKKREFLKCVTNQMESVRIIDTKEYYNNVLTDGKWLADDVSKIQA